MAQVDGKKETQIHELSLEQEIMKTGKSQGCGKAGTPKG